MLRKRSRSQKDQQMGHRIPDSLSESYLNSGALVQKHKVTSFFNVPALFVGLNPKNSESDSVRSPTSPLELRVFSSVGSPLRSQRAPEGPQKIWGCNKVGLSIIDALDNEAKQSGNLPIQHQSKNVIFGPQMSSKVLFCQDRFVDSFDGPKSLPKNISAIPCAKTKLLGLHKGTSSETMRSCSLDSGSSRSHLASRDSNLHSGSVGAESQIFPKISKNVRELSSKLNLIQESSEGCISTSDIELSEDYTCVRTHGPNPKVTHIFCDCILECHNSKFTKFSNNGEDETGLSKGSDSSCKEHLSYPSNFLSFCHTCNKNLEGKDIYIYRGEKAFCSSSCRSVEILNDEEKEKPNKGDDFEKPNAHEGLWENSLFITTL